MIQQKRYGRTVGLPSTVQIVRELKIMMRRDREAAAAVLSADAGGTVATSAGSPSLDGR